MVNSGAAPTSTIAIALINSGSLTLPPSATCQKAVRNLPSLCSQETAFSARRISPIGWPDQCILNVRKISIINVGDAALRLGNYFLPLRTSRSRRSTSMYFPFRLA
jgi:hypothetical protein